MTSQGSGISSAIYVCDGCHDKLILPVYEPLRRPWRAIGVPGWIGRFHACSDLCELRVREKKANK